MLYVYMKTTIVNADDLGMSHEVNKGIFLCHTQGIVTSASLMANMPFFEDAVRLLKEHKTLDTGVHLNLTWGRPLTNAKSLIGSKGEFKQDMIKRLLLGRVDKEAVRAEVKAQIVLCKRHTKISHANSHQHFHVFPSVMKIIADAAADAKIKWIRLPAEPFKIKPNVQPLKAMLLRGFSGRAGKYYKEIGLKHADYFYGIAHTGSLTLESFKNIIANLKEGVTEIMCHPGYCGRMKTDMLAEKREKELKILTSTEIKEAVKEHGIMLISFRDLK